LIEAGGLKGRLTGGAEVSQRHANFIINTGGATAKDIEDLIVEVQSEVALKYGITLKREIHILGATIDS
jgi:UDP-N-acetylmuramate dehydrogenase